MVSKNQVKQVAEKLGMTFEGKADNIVGSGNYTGLGIQYNEEKNLIYVACIYNGEYSDNRLGWMGDDSFTPEKLEFEIKLMRGDFEKK